MRATIPPDPGTHVAVGVDGTDAALRAVRWAAVEASERDLPLLVVHAAPYAAGGGRSAEQVERILARARTVARRAANGPAVHTVGVPQSATVVLREAADRAAVLALGAIGVGLPQDRLADPLILRVVGHTTGPVVVVPREVHRTGPVLVGVDDLRHDAELIGIAHAHAVRYAAPLHVVHAGRASSGAEDDATLDTLVARWDARSPLVSVTLLRTRERPQYALLSRGREARLVVVGPGTRRFHVLAGSTTRALVRGAPCPVLVAGHRSPAAVPSAPADPHLRSELW